MIFVFLNLSLHQGYSAENVMAFLANSDAAFKEQAVRCCSFHEDIA